MPHTKATGAHRGAMVVCRAAVSILAVILAVFQGALVLSSPVAGATSSRNNLAAGTNLERPAELFSPTGTYWLSLTPTGNLVLHAPNRVRVWISNTGTSGATNLSMQSDGNLVLYTPSNVPVWMSGTAGNPGSHLALSDTGVLSVVSPGGLTLWATPAGPTGYQMGRLAPSQALIPNQSLVSPDGAGTLSLLPGGVIVGAKSGSVTLSPSITPCWLASDLVMQNDGNLVDYCGTSPLWFTATGGHPGATAQISNDGVLRVVSATNTVLWPVVVPPTTLAQRIVSIANGQDQQPGSKAVTETPSGSNCNPYTGHFGRGVLQYGSTVIKGKSVPLNCPAGTRAEAWCADFAQWVWTQAGALTAGLNAMSYSFVQYGQANGTFHAATKTYVPRIGDAVIFGTVVGPNGYGSHVGIVTGVNPALGQFQMTSGNWGNGVVQTPMMTLAQWLSPSQNQSGYNLLGYSDPVLPSGASKPAARALAPASPVVAPSQSLIDSQDLGH